MWRLAQVSDIESAKALLLGEVTEFDVASVASWWIDVPVRLGQLQICFDQYAKCVGVISWAYLSDDRHEQMFHRKPNVLHPSEWNEGVQLWIMQLLTRERRAVWGVRAILAELARQSGCVWYGRERMGVVQSRALCLTNTGALRRVTSPPGI